MAHQQESDEYFCTNFRDHFGDVLRRQHPQPTGESREMNEHQRLITQHQHHIGDGFGRSVQQRLELNLGQVFKKLFTVGLQVRDQGVDLLHVIPQTVQRLLESAPVGPLQHAVAFRETGLGKPRP
ncbi:hypothetical protein D3C84_690370 [compost metagenome]